MLAMQCVKHPPVRNKINLADPAQVRAWTRRLGVSVDVLKAVVDKTGNSITAVTKEVELQRAASQASHQPAPSAPSPAAEGELPAQV
jgi:biotin carboxylase